MGYMIQSQLQHRDTQLSHLHFQKVYENLQVSNRKMMILIARYIIQIHLQNLARNLVLHQDFLMQKVRYNKLKYK